MTCWDVGWQFTSLLCIVWGFRKQKWSSGGFFTSYLLSVHWVFFSPTNFSTFLFCLYSPQDGPFEPCPLSHFYSKYWFTVEHSIVLADFLSSEKGRVQSVCAITWIVLWPLTVLEEEYRECVLSLGLSSGLANCPPGVSVIVRTPRWKYDNTLTWHVYFFIDLKSFYFKNCSLFYYLFCILHPVYILQIRPPLEIIREEEGYILYRREGKGRRCWLGDELECCTNH